MRNALHYREIIGSFRTEIIGMKMKYMYIHYITVVINQQGQCGKTHYYKKVNFNKLELHS